MKLPYVGVAYSSNTDRHYNNFGFLYSSDRHKLIKMAPVRVSSAFSGGKEDLEKGKAGKNFVFVKNGHF